LLVGLLVGCVLIGCFNEQIYYSWNQIYEQPTKKI
jgi:hypothetical protein